MRYLSMAWILLFAFSCKSQITDKGLATVVKKNAALLLADKRFNAVSIAVYNNGESFTYHLGELDKGEGNTPSDSTLYEIASVSKTMTGYLVAKAIITGKIKLTDPVHHYLGDAYKNLSYNGNPVTIQHLLTHTSGLPLNVLGIDKLYEKPSKEAYLKAQVLLERYTKKALLQEIRNLELKRKPGTQYSYSNVAPNLLAHILEVIDKQPFEELLKQQLFDVASMNTTAINLSEGKQKLLANGYNDKGELMPNFKKPIQLWGAAGRVKSNAPDMLNYIKFQLQKENPVVKESHTKLFKDLENLWIGYFWEIIEDKYGKHIEHHGGIYGSQNWLLIYPDHDFGISVISNTSFPEANQLLKKTALSIIEESIIN